MADYTSTAAAYQPVTIEDCKTHLNVTHDSDDALIDAYIRAAVNLLENRTQRCFVTQTRKLVMNGFDDSRYVHERVIYPPRSPLKSVSSITYINSSAGTTSTLASTDYIVSAYDKPGRITEAYDATWPTPRSQTNNVIVTYVTGHSTVPSGVPTNIKLAVEQLVAHWYRNRESHSELSLKELPMGLEALLEAEQMETYG